MMTCREASTIIANGSLATAPWRQRLAVWLHLKMCDACRTFKRQMDLVSAAARRAGQAFDEDAPSDLEARVKNRLDL